MEEIIYVLLGKHTLHIKGFCKDAFCLPISEMFYTEDEAVKKLGRSLRFCKKCDEKKEEILRGIVQSRTKEASK